MHIRPLRASPRVAFALTVTALVAAAHPVPARADDAPDPVDPIEDQALREEAEAKFDEALQSFRQAFDRCLEQAAEPGPARDRNLARAEVLLEKIESLTEGTTKQGETEKYLASKDGAALGPLLQGQVDWHRARFLLAEGDREGAAKLADGLGLVREWWVMGPFDNERGRGFKSSQPVEKTLDLDQKLPGKEREVAWRKVPVREVLGHVDLDALLRPNDQGAAYAVAFVKSDAARDAALRLGSDEAVKAWWNGKSVLSRDLRRTLEFDQDVVGVRLAAGWNVLLLKVHDQTGPWGFRARLTTPEGGRLDGISVAATDAEAKEAIAAAPKAEDPQTPVAGGAKSFLDQATSGDVKRARDLFHLGLLHHRREFDAVADRRAENLLKAAAEAEPQNAVFRFHYAEAAAPPVELDAEKEENRQRQGREKALALDPRYAVAYRALARYHTTSLVNLERAEELLRKALEVNPSFVEARLDLSSVLQRRGLTAAAEVERKRALDDARAASLETAARARAQELERLGMGKDAADAWKDVLRLDARGNDVRRRVADLACQAMDREGALAVLDAIHAANPWDVGALRRKAELLEGAEDFAGAESVLGEALAIAPEDDGLLQALGRVQMERNDPVAALRSFRRALEVNPKLQQLERYVEFLDPSAAPFEDEFQTDVKPLLEKAAAWKNDENDGWVVVLDQAVKKVNPDGTSASFVRNVVRILTDAGVKRYATYGAQGWGSFKWKWARVTRADGSVVEAKTDLRRRSAQFPALRPGDVIDVAYRFDEREQGVFGDYFGDWFFFADNVPVLASSYTLVTPAERPFYLHQKNFDVKPTVSEREKDGAKLRVTSWEARDVPKVKYEPGMPDMREIGPQVIVTTYKDWDEFSKWWYAMIRDQRIVTDEMKAKVAELVAGKEERWEKVRAIYEWVAGEITYQAWPFGPHGYKPYTTSAIFDKREGDCKDKALLICAMLDQIGIEAYPVLIYADMGRHEEDMTLPMIGLFNHCIAWVPDVDGKGTPKFLDGTAQYHSAHVPPAMDRGAKVLIVRPEGGEIVKMGEGTPEDFGIDQKWNVELRDDGGARVTGELRFRGDIATQIRGAFSVEGQRKLIVQQILTRVFGKMKLEDVAFDDLKDLSKPEASFRVTADVPGFAKPAGEAFTLPAGFLDTLGQVAQGVDRPEREHDLILGTPVAFRIDATYVLPPGWTVEARPEDADIAVDGAKFQSKSTQEGQSLRVSRAVEVTTTRVRKDGYVAFRDAVNRAMAAGEQTWKVKKGAAPAETVPGADAPK